MPTSRWMQTASLILLGVNWLAEGGFKEKLNKFFSCKPAVAFSLIYVFIVLGLLWSKDLDYAFSHDLLHNSPTLFLPLIIVTSPKLSTKKIQLVLGLFIASVFTVSVIGLLNRLIHPDISFREASPYMPGVYYGMMLILAAFQLPMLIRQVSHSRTLLFAGLVISAWLIFFLFYIRTLTGIASFTGVSLFLIALLITRSKSVLTKISVFASFVLLFGITSWPLMKIYKQTHSEIETDFRTLRAYSDGGNAYYHDTTSIIRENGHLVYIYIADDELKDAWKEKSNMDLNGNDLSDKPLKPTLYRYMSSKGLNKDKQGFMSLTDRDVRAIEKGVTNYLNVPRPGFYVRAYEEMMSLYIYKKSSYKNTDWGSLTKRIDIWRASWQAFKKHPLLGWGTGSILSAVDYGFEKNESRLSGRNMKPHNQYLYIMLTQGITGLIVFIMLYSYVIVKTGVYRITMFFVFLIMFAINFIGSNSLESQLGQNLFVFFTLFYCFLYPQLKRKPGFIY